MKKLFLVLAVISLFSCSNDDNSETSTQEFAYFKAKIDGQTTNLIQNTESDGAYYQQAGFGFHGNGFDRSYYYACTMMKNDMNTEHPTLDLTFHHMTQTDDEAIETANFFTAFDVKPTNFITTVQDSNDIKGISVTYTDANGEYYSTLDGAQTSSVISYSSAETFTSGGLNYIKIKGTVTCMLYKQSDPTQTKSLTNGEFKLTFVEYY